MKQKEEKLMTKIKVVRKDNSNDFKVFVKFSDEFKELLDNNKNDTSKLEEMGKKLHKVIKDLTAECIKQNEKEMTATIVA